jgi:hypothetical protein
MELPMISFFTVERMTMFWQFVKSLMYLAMPLLIIFIATQYGGYLISVLRDVFSYRNHMAHDRDDDGDDNDDDDKY